MGQKNILKIIGLSLCFLAFLFLISFEAKGASLLEKQKELREIQEKIKQTEESIKQKKKEAEELNAAIKNLNKQISETEVKINATQGQINNVQGKINDLKSEINRKEEELKIQKGILAEAIRTIYESGETTLFEIVLGSESLGEMHKRAEYLELVENKIEQTIDKITQLKKELEDKKAEAEKRKGELASLKRQQEGEKFNLDSQKGIKDNLLAQTEEQKQRFKETLGEAKKEQQKINAEIASILASQRGKVTGGPIFSGDWAYPLGSWQYVSAYFLDPSYPWRPFGIEHYGIDLVTPSGSPVYATGDGIVNRVVYPVSSDLAYLYIDHGNGIWTGYLHLSGIYVAQGQIVSKGQNIGTSGGIPGSIGAGYLTTGAHLHFEFRINGNAVNPQNYLGF